MKLLITGAAGFIGYHLSKSLIEDGYDVLGVDNINDYYDQNLKLNRLEILKSYNNFLFKKLDISNKVSVEKLFQSFLPDKVVNLAAQPGVRYSVTNPYEYLFPNLVGFMNIIELCRNYSVNGLIYASSSSVYGKNIDPPFNVNKRVNHPLTVYGATKRANELIAHSYSQLYNLNTTGLRYFSVYGPWCRPDMSMSIFLSNIISGKPISVFNNGNIKRDFTYIDDIIKGTRSALEKNYECEIFNLGNNKSVGLIEVIELIEKELDIKAEINFFPPQSGDMLETISDNKYSQEKISYKPKTAIHLGIPKLVKWYMDYYRIKV